METIQVIYIRREIKFLASIVVFFKDIIWYLAEEVILIDLADIQNFFAFAFGFVRGRVSASSLKRNSCQEW
jgi:uncharacterized protein YebE (UPF0316 family)